MAKHKLILTYAIILIVLSIFIYAIYSTDRTNYYWDGTYYLTDGINGDVALDGNTPSHGDLVSSNGWTISQGSPRYNNTWSTTGGLGFSLCSINTSQNVIMLYNMPDNSSFNGTIGFNSLHNGNNGNFYVTLGFTKDEGGSAGTQRFGMRGDAYNTYYIGTSYDTGIGLLPAGVQYWYFNMTNPNENVTWYINNTRIGSYNGTGITQITLTAEDGATYCINIDEFFIANGDRPTSTSEETLVNPSFSPPTPSATAYNTTNQTINCTHPSGASINYYLWVNNLAYIYNQSQTHLNQYVWQTNFSDNAYTYKCSVQNITSGVFSSNISRALTIDTINPAITLNAGNNFTSANTTIISSLIKNLTIDLSFFDANLNYALINITNTSGQTAYSLLNSSVSATTANYSKSVDVSSWSLGNYTIRLIAKDADSLHTTENHYKIRIGAVIDVYGISKETNNSINITAASGTQTAHGVSNVSAARLENITKETISITINSTGYGTISPIISITNNYINLTYNFTLANTLNIYFYNEYSSNLISGETFSIYLEKSGFSGSYSTASNPYTIKNLNEGTYSIKVSTSNYLERTYENIVISNTTTTNINVYLLNSTVSAQKTFSVTDVGINPLEDVLVVFKRIINGTMTTIAEEMTDYAGQCKLYLDENYEYTINFSKSGYKPKTINLEPIDDSYPIILESATEEISNLSFGITYKFFPLDSVLNNNTKYNFTFQLNSSHWTLTNCTLRLKNGTSILNETSVYTTPSCYIRIEQDTGTMTNITSEAIYELDSSYDITISKNYVVIYTYEGQFSLKNFLDDLTDFGMAGFDSFGRVILALIVIFVVTALAAKNLGFTNPESLIPLIWALVGFFSYINWFYLNYDSIPEITGLRKYIIFILVSLVSVGFFIDKYGR